MNGHQDDEILTRAKVVFVGTVGCGKLTAIRTWFKERLVIDEPNDYSFPTRSDSPIIRISEKEGEPIDYKWHTTVELYPTSGAPDYDALRPITYMCAHVYLLFYDAYSPRSALAALHVFLPELRLANASPHAPNPQAQWPGKLPNVPIVVVANRIDRKPTVQQLYHGINFTPWSIDTEEKHHAEAAANEHKAKAATAATSASSAATAAGDSKSFDHSTLRYTTEDPLAAQRYHETRHPELIATVTRGWRRSEAAPNAFVTPLDGSELAPSPEMRAATIARLGVWRALPAAHTRFPLSFQRMALFVLCANRSNAPSGNGSGSGGGSGSPRPTGIWSVPTILMHAIVSYLPYDAGEAWPLSARDHARLEQYLQQHVPAMAKRFLSAGVTSHICSHSRADHLVIPALRDAARLGVQKARRENGVIKGPPKGCCVVA